MLPILKSFISLCSTPHFHQHLTKYNALDLLNSSRDQKFDYKIAEVAKDVGDKIIDHIDDSYLQPDLDIAMDINSNLPKQKLDNQSRHDYMLDLF